MITIFARKVGQERTFRESTKCHLGTLWQKSIIQDAVQDGVISEGQTTQTRLCWRTIVISENCLSQTEMCFSFVSRTTQTGLGAVSAAANVNKYRYAYAYRATYP